MSGIFKVLIGLGILGGTAYVATEIDRKRQQKELDETLKKAEEALNRHHAEMDRMILEETEQTRKLINETDQLMDGLKELFEEDDDPKTIIKTV